MFSIFTSNLSYLINHDVKSNQLLGQYCGYAYKIAFKDGQKFLLS